MRSLEALAEELIPCPRCEALPGEKCRTITGAKSSRHHSMRDRAVFDAWHIGNDEGMEFAVDHPEPAARMVARRRARRVSGQENTDG